MQAWVAFAAYCVFTLISGAAQDMLYTSYKFYETDAMSLVQSLVLFGLGGLSYFCRQSGYFSSCPPHVPNGVVHDRNPCNFVPLRIQLALGLSIAGNVLLTNYATEYLSFPVQVVFKSSKLLVAMAVRALIFRKPNKAIDYYCGLLLSAGLIGFMWPSSGSSSNSNESVEHSKFLLGLVCVLGSLIAEAVMLNVQEHYLFQQYQVSTEWVMMYGYLYSAISQMALLLGVGELGRTILLLTTLPPGITALLIAFPAFMWVGVTFLLILVKDHGAVAASAANVVRKVIAVAFSFLYFARPVTVPMAIGAAMVFGSIVWRSCVDDHRPVEGNSSPVKMSAQVTPWPGAVNDDTNPEQNPQYAGDDDEENPSYTDNDHDRQESEPLNGSSRNAIARKPSSQTVQH